MLQTTQGQVERAEPPRLDAGRHDYLAFVDGLRAVSILAVVGFHVGLAGFPGGYVGVDIFFVISGFLIINQIKGGLEAGRFSVVGFFARRVLRILPPFLVMVAVTLAVAPFVLTTPTIYLDYMRQAAFSPLMLANFLFYMRQGYFDLHADQKPFLHTWTLSIEEQFYLLAPLTLILLFRFDRKRFGTFAVAVAIALAIASFLGAISYTTTEGRNPAFYFPHWRAWEFIVGGLITRGLADVVARGPRWAVEALGIAGLALIVLAVTMFDARTPFPSWRAAIPVAGAVLVILSGLARPDILAARLLSLRWMVGIGLVSYAWYLWHWPILSYLRILRLGEPSLIPDLLGGGVLAFAIACLSYRYIEQPIRRWRRSAGSATAAGRIVAAGVAGCLALAGLGLATGYAGYRFTAAYTEAHYKTAGQGERDDGCLIFSAADIRDSCFEGPYGLLIGDSHAQALAGSFTRSFHDLGVRLVSVARPGCPPLGFSPQERKRPAHGCRVFLDTYEKILKKPPAFVIFASLWPIRPTVQQMVELIREFDPRTRILLIGRVPIFNYSSLDCVALSDRYTGDRSRCTRPRAQVDASSAPSAAVLKETAAKFGNVRFVEPTGVFCDQTTCKPFDGDEVYFRDNSHVFAPGAERIFAAFRPDFDWLAGKR